MKSRIVKTLTIALVSGLIGPVAMASEAANYFRVWQGFKKPELSQSHFMYELPQFMQDTVDLYVSEGALNNYFVVIPPRNKPDFIPDELALVGLSSEVQYRQIRETPEGQRYSDRHWDVFDRETSSSAKHFIDFWQNPGQGFESGKTYDMVGNPIDWRVGSTYVYIGVRKRGLDKATYLQRLRNHVAELASRFGGRELNGYIVQAHEDYEIAYVNWDSDSALERALGSSEGQRMMEDADSIMNQLMFEKAELFDGGPIGHGRFYKTLPGPREVIPDGCFETGDIWIDC